jgi:hypothetical protein
VTSEVFTAVRMLKMMFFRLLAPSVDANLLEKHTLSSSGLKMRWIQYGDQFVSRIGGLLPTSLHGAKTQKFIIVKLGLLEESALNII